MIPMRNPNGQIFNVEKSQVPRMLVLGWTLVEEQPMLINNINYKVLSTTPRTYKDGNPNPYTLKVQMVNKPYMISYYNPKDSK